MLLAYIFIFILHVMFVVVLASIVVCNVVESGLLWFRCLYFLFDLISVCLCALFGIQVKLGTLFISGVLYLG